MILPPPRSPRTYTLFPYTTLFRSVVDRRDRNRAGGIGDHSGLPHLFGEIHLRRGQGAIAGALPPIIVAGVRGPDGFGDRREIARPLGQHRMADVDMIAIHVRRAVETIGRA